MSVKRKIIYSLLAIFILVSVIFYNRGLFVGYLKDYIVKQVENKVPYKFDIDSVSTNFFNKLIIHNIIIYNKQEKELLTARKLVLYFSIFDFFKNKKELIKKIHSIHLITPHFIFYDDPRDISNSSGSNTFLLPSPIPEIEISNGKITFDITDKYLKDLSIEDIDLALGEYNKGTYSYTLDFETSFNKWASIKILGEYNKDTNNYYFKTWTSGKINLLRYKNYIKDIIPEITDVSGKINFDLDVRGSIKEGLKSLRENLNINGEMSLNSASISIKDILKKSLNIKILDKFSGNIEFVNKQINFKEFIGELNGIRLKFSGYAPDLSRNNLDINYKLGNITLNSIGEVLNVKLLQNNVPNTLGLIDGMIKLDSKGLFISSSLENLNGTLKDISYSIKAELVFDRNELKVVDTFIDLKDIGEIRLASDSLDNNQVFNISCAYLDLKNINPILEKRGLKNITLSGLDIRFSEIKSIYDLFVDAKFNISKGEFLGQTIDNSSINISKNSKEISSELRSTSKIYNYTLDAVLDNEILQVKSLAVNLPDNGILNLDGKVPLNSKNVFNVNFNTLSEGFSILNYFVGSSINVDGGFALSGYIYGDYDQPKADVDINIKCLEGKNELECKVQSSISKELISIKKLVLNESLAGTLNYYLDEKNISASLNCQDIDTSNFISLYKIIKQMNLQNKEMCTYSEKERKILKLLNEGVLNGELKVLYDGSVKQAAGDLRIEYGDNHKFFDKLKLKFKALDNHFEISEVFVSKKERQAVLLGDVFFLDNFRIKETELTGFVKNCKIKNFDLSNKLKFNLDFFKKERFRGGLDLKDIVLNKETISDLTIRFSSKFGLLNFWQISLGDELNGDLSLDLENNKEVKGNIKIKTERLGVLKKILNLKDDISGKIGLELLLDGFLNDLKIRCTLYDNFIKYQDDSLKVYGSLNYNAKTNSNVETGQRPVSSDSRSFFDIEKLSFIINDTNIFKLSGSLDKKNKIKKMNANFKSFNLDLIKKYIKLPLKGIITGSLAVKDEDEYLRVNSDILIKAGGVVGIACSALKGQLLLRKSGFNKVMFDDFIIIDGERELRLKKGSNVNLSNDEITLFLDTHLKDWNFFGLSSGFGGFKLGGNWSKSHRRFEGNIIMENLWLKKYRVNFLEIGLKYENSSLSLFPDENMKGFKGRLLFTDKGTVFDNITYKEEERDFELTGLLKKGGYLELKSIGKNVSSKVYSGIIDFGIPMKGDMDYTLDVSGHLKDPVINTNVHFRNGYMDDLKYDDAYLSLKVEKDKITIDSLDIKRDKHYFLDINGIIPFPLIPTKVSREEILAKELDINFKFEESNLGILEDWLEDAVVKAKGKTFLEGRLHNNIYDPKITARLIVEKGMFSLVDGIKVAKDVNVDIDIQDSYMTVNNFTARIGHGDLKISGKLKFDRFKPDKFDLLFEVPSERGIHISLFYLAIPQSKLIDKILPSVPSRGEFKGQMRLFGSSEDYSMEGVASLNETKFTYPPRPDVRNKIWDREQIEEGSAFGDFLMAAKWDYKLNAGVDNWYENDYVSVAVDGFFHFKGYGHDMRTNGDIDVLRGDIDYLGARFKVISGKFMIIDNEPYIEFEAEKHIERMDSQTKSIREDTIVMKVERAKFAEMKPKFSSKNYPGTSENEAMNLVMTGKNINNMTEEEKNLALRTGLLRLIDSTFTTPIIRTILRGTGVVDMVSFRPGTKEEITEESDQDSATDILEGSRLTVGKYLSSSLFLGYSLGFDRDYQEELDVMHEFEASYRVSKNIFVKGLFERQQETEDNKFQLEYRLPFGQFKKKK